MEQDPATIEKPIDVNQPIVDLLPRYYEVRGTNPSYETVRSMMIDDHEVAWLRYEGSVTYDVTKSGKEGQTYCGHILHCACKFTEGVGWKVTDDGGTTNLMSGDGCAKKDAAVYLRHLELRNEYKGWGTFFDRNRYDTEFIKKVMLDLIEKRKQDEFLEGNTGAGFWGGYYYLQTVGSILDISMTTVNSVASKLIQDKVIRLEGAVVQDYRDPYKPEEYSSLDEVPETIIHPEKPTKIWALAPRPEATDLDLSDTEINDQNRWQILGQCVTGLAHNEEVAQARLNEAITNPRESHSRLYQQSFVEPDYKDGPLAVVAYTARTSDQPEEWIVEGFVGDAVVPEVHKLRMDYQTTWGIDVSDQQNLNVKMEEWWPA